MSSLRKDTILPDTTDAVLIIAGSLNPIVTPKVNDTITIKNVITTITGVNTDPDEASHICQVK